MSNKRKVEQNKHLEKVHRTLKFVANKLNSQKIDWLLGASGALMVWSVDIVPYDLDIFTSVENVKKLSVVFSDYTTNPLHYFQEKDRDYLEFQMKINDVEVEICELDFSPDTLIKIPFENELIPVNPLENELGFYKARKGKEKVVALIERRLKEIKKV